MNNDIKEIIEDMNKLNSINYLTVQDEIDYIIKNNIISNKRIEHVFDKILDLSYWYGNDINDLFYKLYDYYKNLDKNVCNDYENYYKKILKHKKVYQK